VNLGNLLCFEIPTPPLPEQRRIAEILDTLDEAIRKTEQLIAKLKQVKQGLLNDLLTRGIDDNGELRDPTRHPEQFKDSPLGMIPQKWELVHLRELYAEPARNGLYKPSQFHGRGPLMVQMGNIFRGFEVSFDGAGRVKVTPSELATYSLRPGDLLFGRRSLVMEGAGKCALVTCTTEPSTFESSIVRVRVKPDRVVPLFVAYFLTGDAGYRDRRRFIRQVAVSGVSGGDIAEFLIAVPPRREQDGICACIRALNERLAAESGGSDKLRVLKQGLMEDLLTGRVHVTSLLSEAAA
jgi:type I restriction enzyme S subunit